METHEQSVVDAGSAMNPVPADIASPVAADAAATSGAATEAAPLTADAIIEALRAISVRDAEAIGRDEVSRLKGQFYALRKADVDEALTAHLAAGGDAASFIAVADPREQCLKELLEVIRQKKNEYARIVEARQEANAATKEQIIARLREMAADTDNVNRLFPEFRELQERFKAVGDVPPTRTTDLWKQYQEAVEQFYDLLKINKDLRDYDFKKNLEAKTLLCEEAERLLDADDVVAAFRQMQALNDKWRETGPVAKEVRESIWVRFKEPVAVVYRRYQEHFEARKAAEQKNEACKIALCERIEALDFTDVRTNSAWDEMTRHILAAQEEWKQLGQASRKVNNTLFNRFRETCDRFFAAKSAYYNGVREELAQNLAAKTALCEQAEALSTSDDWRATTDAIVELQRSWKSIGPVPRRNSDAVWLRFKQACEKFFDRKKEARSGSRRGEEANLAAKYALVEELRAMQADTLTRDEIVSRVRDAQARWQQIGHVPFKEKDKVYAEFREVIDGLFSRRDEGERRNRRERFESRIKEMGDDAKVSRERERLCRILEQQRAEIKTCENNMGFFSSKSKSGDSMLRDIERRIERLRADMAATEEKIKLIDSKS